MPQEVPFAPGNVPAELVVDFDHYAIDPQSVDPQGDWARRLHNGPDIVWSPHYGGFWVATRAADIEVIQIDHEHFSYRQFDLPRNPDGIRAIPLSLDPPEHTPYRKLLATGFTPQRIRIYADIARQTARELVRSLKPRGECEFIGDFAKVLPINVFLTMMGLPLTDRPFLLPRAEIAVHSNDVELKTRTQMELVGYLMEHIDKRRSGEGEDLLSTIVHGEVEGRPLSEPEILAMSLLALVGGLDTVASQLGFVANFLARNPGHRHELVDNPRLVGNACEELLRRFGLPNTFRELTTDLEYKGLQLRKGEMILGPKCLYGLDDRVNDDPFTVDFHRTPSSIRHSAFGAGPHICVGNVLARREVMIFLEEWLPEIPDFSVDSERPPEFTGGGVISVSKLHLQWTAR